MSPQVATVSIVQIHFEFDNLNIEKSSLLFSYLDDFNHVKNIYLGLCQSGCL
jgi:hypothetical protein